jgi:hypothetical protein
MTLCSWSEMQFNTLMMFSGERPANLGRFARDVAAAYAGMTFRLAESLARAGKHLRVFTNDPDRLVSMAGKRKDLFSPTLLEIDPAIPLDIGFYAAHHKFHVYERFSQEAWPNCFLDTDVVLTKDPIYVQRLLEQPYSVDAWAYDLSAQAFSVSRSVVQEDLIKLGAPNTFPHWYGGEFLMGTPSFFARLTEECKRILPTYYSIYKSLRHHGEEPVVSVAINILGREFTIGEAGSVQLVVRYWTGPVGHAQQKPAILDRCAFWHLPDMKWALGRDSLARTDKRLVRVMQTRHFVLSVREFMR